MAHITPDMVKRIAVLSRLAVDEQDMDDPTATAYCRQLEDILAAIDALDEVDVEGVEPFLSVVPPDNVLRDDEVKDHMERDTALRDSAQRGGGFFKVPEVV